MAFVIALIVLAVLGFVIAFYNRATVYIDFIIGFMAGGLYSFSDYEEGREHTLQICIFILSITVIWMEPPSTGLN